MKILNKLEERFGRKKVRIVLGIFSFLIIFTIVSDKDAENTEEEASKLPIVAVATPLELSNSQVLQLIGTVRSVDEATIDSEAAGRVTAVNVELGATIGAGTVIAQLENASEYASLLQAEGAYEAAQVSAQASTISTQEALNSLQSAQNSALSGYVSAYSALKTALYSSLDEIIADPENTYRTGGVQLADYNQKAGRVDDLFDMSEDMFAAEAVRTTTVENIDSNLAIAIADTDTLMEMTQLLRTVIVDGSDADKVADATELSYLTTLSTTESTLIATRNTLQGSVTALNAAQEVLERASLGDQGTELSTANAQLKQALGSLRAAQANYQKTLLRSPISGVVQSLSVQKGDFVSSFQTVAKVVGEGGLEITTYVGDRERETFSAGQTVSLENGAEGIVTNIAPAVDATTKKTEVRIATDSELIKNGQTVRISVVQESVSDEVIVPLAAVKLTADDASIFFVEEGEIKSRAITLGDVRGSNVVVTEGLAATDVIMVDVRGFASGQQVEIKE